MPFLRILVLAFALVHATGLSDALGIDCDDECLDTQDCGDDGCPPICVTCHCAPCPPAVPPQSATEVVVVQVRPMVATFTHVDDVVKSPDPREILRVPITLHV